MYDEIKKLDKLLTSFEVKHEFKQLYDGYQIIIDCDDFHGYSIIQHKHSYGACRNLLEVAGFETTDGIDDVAGYLTAKEVVERITLEKRVKMVKFKEMQRLHERLIEADIVHVYSVLADGRRITVGDDVTVTQKEGNRGKVLWLEVGELKLENSQTSEEVFSCILFHLSTGGN